jgi:heme exporter protein A
VSLSLSVEDLALSRGGRSLFEGLSFRAGPGDCVALTGRNGAGKTSVLRAVAGLLRPAAGVVRFGDEVEAEDVRAKSIHLVGHQDGLKGGRTVAEELRFWTRWTGGSAASAHVALERFGLTALAALEVRRLSAGQRRRLALARLTAAPRALWLLDEPMAPLDAERREAFGALMREHLAGGGLIVAAVHDPLPLPTRDIVIGASA